MTQSKFTAVLSSLVVTLTIIRCSGDQALDQSDKLFPVATATETETPTQEPTMVSLIDTDNNVDLASSHPEQPQWKLIGTGSYWINVEDPEFVDNPEYYGVKKFNFQQSFEPDETLPWVRIDTTHMDGVVYDGPPYYLEARFWGFWDEPSQTYIACAYDRWFDESNTWWEDNMLSKEKTGPCVLTE